MPSKTQNKKPTTVPKDRDDRGRSRTPAKEISRQDPIGDPKPDPRGEVVD